MFSEREEGGNITVDSTAGTRFEGESTVRNMSKGCGQARQRQIQGRDHESEGVLHVQE